MCFLSARRTVVGILTMGTARRTRAVAAMAEISKSARTDDSPICYGCCLAEFGGGSVSVEGGNGFDKAGHGEGVTYAAGLADEVEGTADAGQRNRNAHERGDAGTVNLWNSIEVYDDLAARLIEDGLKRVGELVAGLTDGQAPVHVKNVNAVLFADVDFDRGVLGHGSDLKG